MILKFQKGKECKMQKKTVLRMIIFTLIIIWMIVVFILSNQPANASSTLSRNVIRIFIQEEETISQIEPWIRKIAHLSEYAIRWNIVLHFIFDL